MEVRTTRIAGLEQLWVTRARSTLPSQSIVTQRGDSTRVSISQEADLLRQMASLKSSDPDKFKDLVGSLSQNLTAASQNPAAGEVNSDLSKLARSLEMVARTGDPGSMEGISTRQSNRAIDAYLKNARPAPQPSDTSRQALQYVMNTLAEANQDVAPVEATGAAR